MRAPIVRLLFTALVIAGTAAPVGASCRTIPEPRDAVAMADVAFVGTVVLLTNGDRWATVAVEEVWRGPDLPATVEVRGGPGGNMGSSIDRTYRRTRYLFLVAPVGGQLTDSSCSGTTEWHVGLEPLRPDNARQPVGPRPEPGATVAPFIGGELMVVGAAGLTLLGAVVLFGVVALIAIRRRRDA